MLFDGEWLISDALLQSFFDGLSVSELNRFASENGVAYRKLKRSQVIDISSHLCISINRGKHESNGYTKTDACSLVDKITDRYLGEGCDRNKIKRAINHGHDARLKAPTPIYLWPWAVLQL